MSTVKVNMLPLQAHCFAFGGFEIQMLELVKALQNLPEVAVKKMNPWDKNDDFDVLHLWGLEQANYNNAFWAKKNGKKVVLTALIGQITTFIEAARFAVSKKIGNVRFLLRVLEHVDALAVVNELEAKKAIDHFKLPKKKVFIIPNIITPEAVAAIHTTDAPLISESPYFLCAGNISERKNQVVLAKAAVEANSRVVFAGNFICEEVYRKEFLKLMENNSNLSYSGNFGNTSPQLFNLFKYASGFCLPSSQETQPISVLEAALFRKNILIGNGAYSKQQLFRNLLKVDGGSIASVRDGLMTLERVQYEEKHTIEQDEISQCFAPKVAIEYQKIYLSKA
jgi:glycosyltransferase involved in cell wall biosynthesis